MLIQYVPPGDQELACTSERLRGHKSVSLTWQKRKLRFWESTAQPGLLATNNFRVAKFLVYRGWRGKLARHFFQGFCFWKQGVEITLGQLKGTGQFLFMVGIVGDQRWRTIIACCWSQSSFLCMESWHLLATLPCLSDSFSIQPVGIFLKLMGVCI